MPSCQHLGFRAVPSRSLLRGRRAQSGLKTEETRPEPSNGSVRESQMKIVVGLLELVLVVTILLAYDLAY